MKLFAVTLPLITSLLAAVAIADQCSANVACGPDSPCEVQGTNPCDGSSFTAEIPAGQCKYVDCNCDTSTISLVDCEQVDDPGRK